MQCPICANPAAKDAAPTTDDYSRFDCPSPTCGLFEMDRTAVAVAAHKTPEARLRAMERAQREAQPGQLPRIKEGMLL
jgi:hypothetical protein